MRGGGEEEGRRSYPGGEKFLKSKSFKGKGRSSLEVVSWSLDVIRAIAETCQPEIIIK